ncbi:Acyl-CoA N-acyltransferase [Purpureocillium lilacinum]|uniref:Acyl-CoA N-acyltransferase n=1 Tax=Purpureocillium lilacinum TaxID=33203 RepID=A0A179HI21_PURLI|nr:Acyl-CoA N-acyltransferase [Purpureocillium lilacinum]OAQ89975.1 Acyl-CoA N-acyltransferase [Purpureocillium lilacinum]
MASSATPDDAGLVLAHPNDDEQVRTWTHTHPSWGPSYPLDVYLARERELLTVPLARDGGIRQWILTTPSPASASATGGTSSESSSSNNNRPVLSSCETLRKRALVRSPGQPTVRDVHAHGVASVFTYPEFRRKGYAARMLDQLGKKLADDEARQPGDAAFSVLFSDIGKKFYAALDWAPFESSHLTLPAAVSGDASASARGDVTPITDDNLELLVALDEKLLRERMAADDDANPTTKTRVAILPDMDHMRWHFAREAFMSTHHLGRAPTVHGAVYTSPSNGSRVWAIWVRVHSGGTMNPAKNVVYIQRSVVENSSISDAELSQAWRAILEVARVEAREWMCSRVDMWNPDERTKRLIVQMEDLKAQYVVREEDSITSLRWFGDGSVQRVEWVANERYEWC